MRDDNLLISLFPGEPGVEAFYTQREATLPYPVIQGHQVHGSRVAIVDRPGMTREELEGYDVSKGAIRLPYDRELPADLITRIAVWCWQKYAK